MAHIVWTRLIENMCMVLAFQLSLRLPADKGAGDALVLDVNKGPSLLYKSDHIRCFCVHLVCMEQKMMS
jgi:hypothetical protein